MSALRRLLRTLGRREAPDGARVESALAEQRAAQLMREQVRRRQSGQGGGSTWDSGAGPF